MGNFADIQRIWISESIGPMRDTLARAKVECLQPSSAVRLLEFCLETGAPYRHIVLRKVAADIADGELGCHLRLLSSLLSRLSSLPCPNRSTLAYVACELGKQAGVSTRLKVARQFCESSFVGIRRRGYKLLDSDLAFCADTALSAWDAHSDPECAWLLARRLPDELAIAARRSLIEGLSDWRLAKFYIRISTLKPRVLHELSSLDEISYVYACVKRNARIPRRRLLDIVVRNLSDPRAGLLIWCLGKLKARSLLLDVEEQLPRIWGQRLLASQMVGNDRLGL